MLQRLKIDLEVVEILRCLTLEYRIKTTLTNEQEYWNIGTDKLL